MFGPRFGDTDPSCPGRHPRAKPVMYLIGGLSTKKVRDLLGFTFTADCSTVRLDAKDPEGCLKQYSSIFDETLAITW
jgi:hypothetical protein